MGQPQLAEEDLSQLLGGIDVEFLPGHAVDVLFQRVGLFREHFSEGHQRSLVHPAACQLHFRQNPAQGQLRRGVKLPEVQFFQSGQQRLVQRAHSGGIAVKGRFRRRGIPQQGKGVRLQIDGLSQLRMEVAGKQLPDLIFAAGGVRQIGSQRRVEHKALCIQAVFQQRPHQILDVMAHLFDIAGKQGIQQGVPVPGIAFKEKFCRQGGIRPHAAVHDDPGEIRQGQHRHCFRLPELLQQLRRPTFLRDALHRHGHVRCCPGGWRFLRPQVHFIDELGKFQPQKQGIRFRPRRLHPVRRRVKGQRRIGDDGGQPVRVPGLLLPRRQFFDGGRLGVDFRQLLINSIHTAIFLNQIHGGLFPDPRYAWDIVGGVPHEGFQVDHMDRRKAVLLPEGFWGHVFGGGLPHAGRHQLHLGVFRDELEGVLVSRHHHAIPARRFALPGNGTDEVVGLPPLQFIAGDVQGVQHLFQNRHLHPQLLRHRLPGGLIGRVRLVAERGGVEVKGNAQGVRLFFFLQAQQRGEEAEDGVGIQPLPIGQGTDAVIGPVDDGIAVNDHALHEKTSGINMAQL